MPLPAKITNRYTSGRQMVVGSDMNALFDFLFSSQALLAAGVAQADAALVNGAQVEVLAGSANNAGIKLPVAYPGNEISVLNNSANTTIVYGTGNDRVQTTGTTYAAIAAGINMATLTSAIYRCVKAGFWQRVITA